MMFSLFSMFTVLPLSTRLRLGRRYFTSPKANVVQVSPRRFIKGPCYPCELEAMLYVRAHTTIPVPRVYRTYPAPDGRIYIEMERIDGITLAEWWPEAGQAVDAKTAIMADLRDVVDQLRRLPPPTQGIVASASTKEGLVDGRIVTETFGPFPSHDEFHTFLRGGVPLKDTQKVYGDAIFQVHAKHYKTCFTHADLVPRNIIIRNGRVAAIIDWGFSGWYPEYWEYTKMYFAYVEEDWYKIVGETMPQYDAELAAERILCQLCDEPGVARRYPSE